MEGPKTFGLENTHKEDQLAHIVCKITIRGGRVAIRNRFSGHTRGSEERSVHIVLSWRERRKRSGLGMQCTNVYRAGKSGEKEERRAGGPEVGTHTGIGGRPHRGEALPARSWRRW